MQAGRQFVEIQSVVLMAIYEYMPHKTYTLRRVRPTRGEGVQLSVVIEAMLLQKYLLTATVI